MKVTPPSVLQDTQMQLLTDDCMHMGDTTETRMVPGNQSEDVRGPVNSWIYSFGRIHFMDQKSGMVVLLTWEDEVKGM